MANRKPKKRRVTAKGLLRERLRFVSVEISRQMDSLHEIKQGVETEAEEQLLDGTIETLNIAVKSLESIQL